MSGARSAEQWGEFLVDHMPQGAALDLEPGSLLRRKLDTLAIEFARFDALVDLIDREFDPRTTEFYIDDWERMLDLPRFCQSPPETLQLRRAIVVSLLLRSGDLSPATIIEAAAIHGYDITIREYFPYTVPGDLPYSNAFKYDVTVAGEKEIVDFETGTAQAGDYLGTIEQNELECLLWEIEPAYAEHTIL